MMPLKHSPARQHERAAFHTISEFCANYRISRSIIYQSRQVGPGPRVKQIGTKTLLINVAAATHRWSVRS